MSEAASIVFLVDVDNTLLEHGRCPMFPRPGQYARDAKSYPPADPAVQRIGDLAAHDLSELLSLEVPR